MGQVCAHAQAAHGPAPAWSGKSSRAGAGARPSASLADGTSGSVACRAFFWPARRAPGLGLGLP